jgi:hypothetical protein
VTTPAEAIGRAAKPYTWVNVTREHPCPICGKPDWCGISTDGRTIHCRRQSSDKETRVGGWIHQTDPDPTRLIVAPPRRPPRPPAQLQHLARTWIGNIRDRQEHLEQFAGQLGLDPDCLASLGIGWTRSAWSWPMFDADRNVVGIRLRCPRTHRKFAVRGSREGVFLPAALLHDGPLLVTEGPTDAAAMMGFGFDVIGRPSCRGAEDIVVRLCKGAPHVVLLADRDQPGIDGATHLAQRLALVASKVTLLIPPAPFKDARDWARSGTIDRAAVQDAVATSFVVRLPLGGASR